MALRDYRLCDVCGGKAFYHANLDYDYDAEPDALVRDRDYGLEHVGDWCVLCSECAQTRHIIVVPNDESAQLKQRGGAAKASDECVTMIEDCEYCESRLSERERNFISSLRSQVDGGRGLTEKQIDALNACWDHATRRG